MKYAFFLLLIFVQVTHAQSDLMEKEKLGKLLEERKAKFSNYFNSIEKRSGIFGNKTRKDIQQSNEVLIDIVKTDNNIISVLNRALDFKSYEKTSFNYDKLEQDERLNRLETENQALIYKMENINNGLKQTQNQLLIYKSLFYLGIVVTVACFIILRKRKLL